MFVKYFLCLLLLFLLFSWIPPQTTAKNYYNPIMDVNVTHQEQTDKIVIPLEIMHYFFEVENGTFKFFENQLEVYSRKSHIILNSTLIDEGPQLFKFNGVQNVVHYEVTIPCSDKNMPISKPYLKIMHGMTYYYHYYFTCVDEEARVCSGRNDFFSNKKSFVYSRNIFMRTTSGIPMLVQNWEKYYLCSFKNNQVVTYYTEHERLHDMNISLSEYEEMPEDKKRDINARSKEMLETWKKQKMDLIAGGVEPTIFDYGVLNDVMKNLIIVYWLGRLFD